MTITVEFPDAVASILFVHGGDPARTILETMALEGYRSGKLGENALSRLLGISRLEVHAFLKEHDVPLQYSMEDLEHDIKEGDRIAALYLERTKASKPQ